MKEYFYFFKLYTFFNHPFVVLIRLAVGALLLAGFLVFWGKENITHMLLALYTLFMMNELFIFARVNRTRPHTGIKNVSGSLTEAVSFSALTLYQEAENISHLAKMLVEKKENRFILEKIGQGFHLQEKNQPKELLLQKAAELVATTGGRYITEVDLFVAYLFLYEEETKYFQNNDLKSQDVVNILHWARNKFSVDKFPSVDLVYRGSSFGDFLVYGWDVEIRKYTVDFTSRVLNLRTSPKVIGREKEYERLLGVLSKEKNNNAILVGEPGTGKTTIVEYFAYKSHLGEAPPNLARKRVFELLADRLIAGASNQGELEERIGYFLSDVRHTGNAVVFIQNIENIFGGGGYNFDISGVIFEYLEDMRIPFIGSTNPSAFRMYLERKASLLDFFEVVRLEEPGEEETLFMLFEKVGEIESEHRVHFTYNAVREAVELSASYLLDTYLPGKALNLLDAVAADAALAKKTLVDKNEVVKKIEEETKVLIASPTPEEKERLLHLEEEIHKRIVDQEQAVNVIAEAMRRVRSGFVNEKRPIAVFLFLGPTGVGKTETAKALAALYFGSEERMIRLDMSEYQTQESIKRLLGSLPGEEYVPSEFTEQVRLHPFSVILLDEFEKAHSRILDIFLQVFDEGRLTDNRGHTVSFRNSIIIATSNAGSEFIREKLIEAIDMVRLKKELLDYLLRQQLFRPELLNRFDDMVMFKPLGEKEVVQIAELLLSGVLKTLEEKQIFIAHDEKVIEKIAKESFDREFGARNIRRYVQQHIQGFLSTMILENKIKKGDKKTLTVNEYGEFVFQ